MNFLCYLQMVVNVMTNGIYSSSFVHQQDHYFYVINEIGEEKRISNSFPVIYLQLTSSEQI